MIQKRSKLKEMAMGKGIDRDAVEDRSISIRAEGRTAPARGI